MAAQFFKTTLTVKKQPGDESVRFKVDGGRFQDSDKTIKMNVNCKYSLEFVFKPAMLITRLNIQGGNVTPDCTKNEPSCSTYTCEWVSSGVQTSKRGARQTIPILIELKDGGSVKFNLQCKFYGEQEKAHSNWGDVVNYIEYDCKRLEGSTFIETVKETMR